MKPAKKYSKRQYAVLRALRAARTQKRLPQKVVAHRAGYHSMTLGRWERGETLPSLQALHDWCAALGVRLTVEAAP